MTIVGDWDPTVGKVKKNKMPVLLLVSGISDTYTVSCMPATVNPLDFIL